MNNDKNTVCILMSTYNGKKYIIEQIESLLRQKDVSFSIYVRDDGSQDGTQKILDKYEAQTNGLLKWYQGKNIRPAKSFMDLIKNAPDAQYYAFCDQDDVWEEDKLSCAIAKIKREKEGIPCFYFSNVKVVDEKLNLMKISHIDEKNMSLKRILLHNVATGCTIVFNEQLMKKIREYSPQYIGMHDWWLYQVCLVIGGKVVFDKEPHILYRQHGNNCIGFKKKKINVKKAILKKSECGVRKMTKELIEGYGEQMSSDVFSAVSLLAFYDKSLKKKWRLLTDKEYYRDFKDERVRDKIAILRNRK